MLFRRRRKTRIPTPKNAQTVGWIVFGVLMLGLTNNYVRTGSPSSTQSTQELKDGLVKAAPVAAIDFHNFSGLLPESEPQISISDKLEGDGEPAVCGQKVSLRYSSATLDGKPIEEDAKSSFTIGDDSAMPAFEQGVVGMKKGGKRIIFSPSGAAYSAQNFTRDDVKRGTRVAFSVEMLAITPPLPSAADSPFRISETQQGQGKYVMCGDEVTAHFTVFDITGKKLFSTHDKDAPVRFTTGKSQVFLGLEQGVIGISLGGKRNLIVPPGFQKRMDGKAANPEIPFPPKQTVLVDVETLP